MTIKELIFKNTETLTGFVGNFANMIYTLQIPLNFCSYTIVHLEIEYWPHLNCGLQPVADKYVEIYCDNLAVVQVLHNGRTKDNILATCARNIWLIMAMYNIHVLVSHIPGKINE